MRALQFLALACLPQLACDVKKLGVEGATCSASSDCADDLQCMQSVCVRPQAAGVAARPAPPPAPSVPVPVASATPAPPPAAAPPVATPPLAAARPEAAPAAAPPPALTPPPQPQPGPAPADATQPRSGIPWLNRGAEVAPPAPAPTPSSPTDPASFFTDPGSWTALVESGEPWAVSVLKAFQGIRIGFYGGGSPPILRYKFRLAVCRDGRVESHRRQSTGDAKTDSAIDNAIEALKVAAPPPAIRAQIAGACKKIPYDFTMKIAGAKLEVK